MKKLIVLLAIMLTTMQLKAQDYFKPIDSIMKLYDGKNKPGFTVLVSKNGKVLYSKQAGYANLEGKEKITDKTVFAIASTSKQFTAACIVLLEQQGKLNFNDNLRKYIPEFPEYAERITINQLLNHTGGLKDYRSLAMLRGDNSEDYSAKQIKKMLIAQDLNDEPGANWNYSNSGYWCLGQIIEKVSGMSVGAFAEKNIFRPLKMKNTRYVLRSNNTVKNAAIGYENNEKGYSPSEIDEFFVGGAGVYSTANDLQKWLFEMQTHHVFGDAFWKAMVAGNPAQGKGFVYTKGLFNLKYANHTMINHGGDVVGFHCITAYFPDDKIAIVVLSNDDDFERYPVLGAAVDLLLGDKYDYPKVANATDTVAKIQAEAVTIDPAIQESYVGNYELSSGYVIKITIEEGKLKMTQLWNKVGLLLQPAKEEHHFNVEDLSLIFSGFKLGKATELRIVGDGENSLFKRLDKDPDVTIYDKYTGSFYCKSLDSKITLFTENGILYYRMGDKESYSASPPQAEDLFSTSHGKITFIKDEKGEFTAFTLSHPRAINMQFVKQNAIK
ncbi:serine hydrolase domain-containing protein [Flavobacterium kingsejongi]|uniref:Beta-lactamase-related domain-containing protein n=1 Tax=Flavobacterium kingsejongi TaxID=1678728 RepID=A0A2S1LSP2_9FLAO|nr:serine hydrolase domain-containing protein [Flavobacterium kingsejongi]AWG26749.1 hypothetical protein FK004_16695 [Flavobacterium kingsejongi]